jgi:hypothetical protein
MRDATRHDAAPHPPTIRPVSAADVPALKAVIDSTGLFPSELLDGMLAGYLDGQSGDERWLTVDDEEEGAGAVAVAYVAPERGARLLLVETSSLPKLRALGRVLRRERRYRGGAHLRVLRGRGAQGGVLEGAPRGVSVAPNL